MGGEGEEWGEIEEMGGGRLRGWGRGRRLLGGGRGKRGNCYEKKTFVLKDGKR